MNYSFLRSTLVLLFVILAGACGGGEQTEEVGESNLEVVQTEFHTEQPVTLRSLGDDQAKMLTELAEKGSLSPKPIALNSRKYVDNLIQGQIRKAYSESGEYIDPLAVKELLHDELSEDESDAETLPQDENVAKTWRMSYDIHKAANKLYSENKFDEAARTWQGLPAVARAFTISVEIHCDTQELRKSFTAIAEVDAPVFILPERVQGKTCYRLCVGIFEDRETADPYMESIREKLPIAYPFVMSIARQ